MALWLGACATFGGGGTRKVELQGSAKDPSAEGQVVASEGKNGNTKVQVTAKHLAHPEKLDPPAQTYVVWIVPPGNDTHVQNMGALKVNKNLDGTLQTVVPWKSFQLFITPEVHPDGQEPQGDKLMWATVGS